MAPLARVQLGEIGGVDAKYGQALEGNYYFSPNPRRSWQIPKGMKQNRCGAAAQSASVTQSIFVQTPKRQTPGALH